MAGVVPTVILLSACGSRPVPVQVPQVKPSAAGVCRSLARVLPDEVDGRARAATEPVSARTAAWGDPPVVLRCGVDKPVELTPDAEILEVNGVEWVLRESPHDFTFTTVGRTAYVELRVPGAVHRSEATAPLVDLADPVRRAVPLAGS